MTTILFGSYNRLSMAFVTICFGMVLSLTENLCSKAYYTKPSSEGKLLLEEAPVFPPYLPDLGLNPPNSVGKPPMPEPVVLFGVISTEISL